MNVQKVTVNQLKVFSQVQMAAEALYDIDARKSSLNQPGKIISETPISSDWLTTGNGHASKFTETDATNFVSEWTLIEHISNTKSGFSGTLFQNKDTKEYVLSCRSTEFIDDAARDCEATNNLEIRQTGWAFGQIDDLENWYQTSLKSKIAGGKLNVTGYSLGGHLATAFNLMHQSELNGGQVVTFNGAGVGRINGSDISNSSQLTNMINTFHAYRNNAGDKTKSLFMSEKGKALYTEIKSFLNTKRGTVGDIQASELSSYIAKVTTTGGQLSANEVNDFALLKNALERIQAIVAENDRVFGLNSGGEVNTKPAFVHDGQIGAEDLDYQLAVLQTSDQFNTSSYNTSPVSPNAIGAIFDGKYIAPKQLNNQFDVVGTEMDGAIAASMVANSQVHYGQDTKVFIEDQPGYRGSAAALAAWESAKNFAVKLLLPEYAVNDFGDTHSLVLIVDSLSVVDVLQKISPTTAVNDIYQILQSSSNLQASFISGKQGLCEGNVLEQTVASLCNLLSIDADKMTPLREGNSWWDTEQREVLYKNLEKITTCDAYKNLLGKVELKLSCADLASQATGKDSASQQDIATRSRTDFSALLTLLNLSSFTLVGTTAENQTYLDKELGLVHADIYAKWQSDKKLTATELANGKGNFSNAYLSDRAQMLAWMTEGNFQNLSTDSISEVNVKSFMPGVGQKWNYINHENNIKVSVSAEPSLDYYYDPKSGSFKAWEQSFIAFGDSEANTLKGGVNADRLYGGDGDDTLISNGGDDYLEGGNGNDSYQISSGRVVKLLDFDGKGSILWDGQLLAGSTNLTESEWKHIGTGLWKDAKNNITYSLQKSSEGIYQLFVVKGNEKLIIDNWNIGQLGISGLSLDETALAVAAPEAKAMLASAYLASADIKYIYGTGASETLLGSGDNEFIYGNGGKDILIGGGSADAIRGGDGDDIIYGENKVTDITAYIKASNSAASVAAMGDFLYGSAGNDTIVGGNKVDTIKAGDGDDFIVAGAGNDFIDCDGNGFPNDFNYTWVLQDGGSKPYGEYVLNGLGYSRLDGKGNDTVYAGSGDDHCWLGSGDDIAFGGDGNDEINGEDGGDIIYGNAGNDSLSGDALWIDEKFHGADYLDGGDGDDGITGFGGNDTLIGGAGNDTLLGDEWYYEGYYNPDEADGDDTLLGGAGNDDLFGGGRNDVLDGGDGDDDICGDGGTNSTIGTSDGRDKLYGGAGNDKLWGGGNDDILDGGIGDDILRGDGPELEGQYHGDDTINGGDGNDGISGDGGNDIINGGSGNDIIDGDNVDLASEFHGNDIIDGGVGDDSIHGNYGDDIIRGGSGIDYMQGQEGNDTYVFNVGDSAPRVTFTTDSNGNITQSSVVETVDDSIGNNVISFGSGVNKDSVSISEAGSNLFVQYGVNDEFLLKSTAPDAFSFKFSDGTSTTIADLLLANLRGDSSDNEIWGYDKSNPYLNGKSSQLFGYDGDDYLEGGNGDDSLYGGNGNDHFFANEGDDKLFGDDGDDLITGGAGNDTLDGGTGNDVYFYNDGDGRDVILNQGGGKDYIVFQSSSIKKELMGFQRAQDDLIIVVNGDQTQSVCVRNYFSSITSVVPLIQFKSDGKTYVYGKDNINSLITDFGGKETTSTASAGNSSLSGSSLRDQLIGSTGNNTLSGGAGNDRLDGNAGNDLLYGGAGSDSYYFGKGDGADVIYDYDQTDSNHSFHTDRLVFKSGISMSDVNYNLSGTDLVLSIKNTSDQITIKQWFDGEQYQLNSIVFNDGSMLDLQQINTLLHTQMGDSADNVLQSLSGNDYLSGGSGSDTYLFGKGDGQDVIYDYDTADAGDINHKDILKFNPGLVKSDISFTREGSDLVCSIINSTDKVSVNNWFAGTEFKLSSFVFSDGSSLTAKEVDVLSSSQYGTTASDTMIGSVNADYFYGLAGNDYISTDAGDDILDGGAGDDILDGGAGSDYFVTSTGADSLIDAEGNDYYQINSKDFVDASAKTVINDGDGKGLLHLDNDVIEGKALTATSKTTWKANSGAYTLELKAGSLFISMKDAAGSVEIKNFVNSKDGYLGLVLPEYSEQPDPQVNHAPVLAAPLPDKTAKEDKAFKFVLPAGTFTDSDSGDSLSLSATLSNGKALPTWLKFNAKTRTFSGTPDNDQVGALAIRVTATDKAGAKASDVFKITVQNINDAPEVATALPEKQDAKEGALFKYVAPLNEVFKDVDKGDVLTYSSTLADGSALPAWLQFDAATGTFSGTPVAGSAGQLGLVVTATDKAGASVSNGFSLNIAATINVLKGTSANDTLKGSEGQDKIYGYDGDDTLYGRGGDDALSGSNGNDRLDGGAGNDTLSGGAGNDTYYFGKGYGQDLISDTDATVNNQDRLLFKSGIATDQLWFKNSNNNLEVSIIGTSDTITIKNWFTNSNAHVEQFKTADGKTLLDSQVANLVNAMATLTPPAAGETSLSTAYHNKLDAVIAANWK